MLKQAILFAILLAAPAHASPEGGPRPEDECVRELARAEPPPLPFQDLSTQEIYDLFLHRSYNHRSAVNFLKAASTNSDLRAEANTALSKNGFARWASRLGLRFRERLLAYVKSRPAGIPSGWLLRPSATLLGEFSRFMKHQRGAAVRPIADPTAHTRALADTKDSLGLNVEPADQDLARGTETHFTYARHMVRRQQNEEPRITSNQARLDATRQWLDAVEHRLRDYREANIKQAIQDFTTARGTLYVGSTPVTGLTLEKATSYFDTRNPPQEDGVLTMRPKVLEAPVRHVFARVRLFFEGMRTLFLSLGKRNDMFSSQNITFIRNQTDAWLMVPTDNAVTTVSYSQFFNVFERQSLMIEAMRLTERDWLKQRLRIASEIDLALSRLIGEIEPLKNLPSVKRIENAILQMSRLEARAIHQHHSNARIFNHAAATARNDSPDTLDGIEWFGYGMMHEHWLWRDTESRGENRTKLSMPARAWHGIRNQFTKLTRFSVLSLMLSGTMGAAYSIAHVIPPNPFGVFGYSSEPETTLSAPELGDATNDGSDDSAAHPGLFTVAALTDPVPMVFDEAHTDEMNETSEWEAVDTLESARSWIFDPPLQPDPDALLLRSEVPLTTDEQGRLMVPVPRGFRVMGLDITASHRGDVTDETLTRAAEQYTVLRHRRTGNYMVQVNPASIAEHHWRYYTYSVLRLVRDTTMDNHLDSPEAAEFADLNVARVLAVVDQLDDAGLEGLSRALRAMIAKHQAEGRPLSLSDLENIFAESQIYSHEEEGFRSITSWFSDNPFTAYDRFLEHDGRLHYECDGANYLFADFLRAYFAGNGDIVVENITSHTAVYRKGPSSVFHGHLTQGHVRTLVSLRGHDGHWRSVMLDATARNRALRHRRPVPLAPVDLPEHTPMLLPENRVAIKQRRPAPTGPSELQRQQQMLTEARHALIHVPGYVDLLRDDRGGMPPFRRAAHLAHLLLALSSGAKTHEDAASKLRDLYGRLDFAGLDTPEEWRTALQLVFRTETLAMSRLARLAARRDDLPWFSNIMLQDHTTALLRVAAAHDWLPHGRAISDR